MEGSRWWHVAVIGAAVVLAGLVVVNQPTTVELVGALSADAAFVLGWLLVGRHAVHSTRAGTAFIIITIVLAGVGAAFSPTMATIQTIAYPIVWILAKTLRDAIIANIALAVTVGVGIFIGSGSLSQALIVQGLSLAFSLALGLWITGIAQRSEERQRLLDELRATQHRLAAVNRDAGIASERERLAREIHDTIAQDLTGLVLLTQRARRELAAGAGADATLELLEHGARAALVETRGLVAASAPLELATGGIGAALERLAARFGRETDIRVTVSVDGLPVLDRDTEVVLLRCAQEGLANVRKHSRAATASVTLSTAGPVATLAISDDGHGFDPGADTGGFGLGGMRDRLGLVGGALDVASSPTGTVLTATLPLAVPA